MKYFLLVAFICTATLAAQPAPGGSIEGHVYNSLTGAPIRKAPVNLNSARVQLVAQTDAEGRFQFTGLPAGSYKLSAAHVGFLDHGARRLVPLGQDSHITDAEIRLPPQGVIAGRVLDEDGEPIGGKGVFVRIFKQAYRQGKKQWDEINPRTIASETGDYRFSNLKPGRYLVEALNQGLPVIQNQYSGRDTPDQPQMFYANTYYPGAESEEASSPVEVGVGADLRGIDIHLVNGRCLRVSASAGK